MDHEGASDRYARLERLNQRPARKLCQISFAVRTVSDPDVEDRKARGVQPLPESGHHLRKAARPFLCLLGRFLRVALTLIPEDAGKPPASFPGARDTGAEEARSAVIRLPAHYGTGALGARDQRDWAPLPLSQHAGEGETGANRRQRVVRRDQVDLAGCVIQRVERRSPTAIIAVERDTRIGDPLFRRQIRQQAPAGHVRLTRQNVDVRPFAGGASGGEQQTS